MMPKLPEPDCMSYAPYLGKVAGYWLEQSVRAIQEEAYRAGMEEGFWKARADQLLSVPVPDDAPTHSGAMRSATPEVK